MSDRDAPVTPPVLLVSPEVGERLVARIAKPRKPTAAMLALFARRDRRG